MDDLVGIEWFDIGLDMTEVYIILAIIFINTSASTLYYVPPTK